MALLHSLLLASTVAMATDSSVLDVLECTVVDNTHSTLPVASIEGRKSVGNAELLSTDESNNPSHSASTTPVEKVVQEKSTPSKLSVFGQNTVEYKLRDSRFTVTVAHYTGTIQILLNDRKKKAWLVKATTPDRKFTGLALESAKPSIIVNCESGIKNSEVKGKND